jgi:hypothetical protein
LGDLRTLAKAALKMAPKNKSGSSGNRVGDPRRS